MLESIDPSHLQPAPSAKHIPMALKAHPKLTPSAPKRTPSAPYEISSVRRNKKEGILSDTLFHAHYYEKNYYFFTNFTVATTLPSFSTVRK